MSPICDFTDNAFQSRSDLVRAAEALLRPVQKYCSPGGARIKFRPSTAAHYDDVAAQLEGFARPLWAIACLLKNNEAGENEDYISMWLRGLDAGTDRNGPEYWGDIGDFDQRMVEMESIAFLLLMAPDKVMPSLHERAKQNLKSWLLQINDHDMPQNNWLWFRVFVNLALIKVFQVTRESVQPFIDQAFTFLDSFKVGEGWSTDGAWSSFTKQADYYSGSFAIQFAQLLYVHLCPEDTERVAVYRREAREFSSKFWRYFDTSGAAIPFGRSLTYRFAVAAFWAAAALAGVELSAPVSRMGSVKGILLRHLRWWSTRHDIFSSDGILSIGFAYPNLYMSEEYNSPQSVYWCLKSFVILALPEEHPFWTCNELPHPLNESLLSDSSSLEAIEIVWPPRHIISNTRAHHFLLSSGQMTKKPHKGREAKYGKFAYSSAFGFSVPTGQLLQYIPPDSTICASIDGGESWIQRAEPSNVRLDSVRISGTGNEGVQSVPCLVSAWKPWPRIGLEIETTLVPLGDHFSGWHIRMHKVQWTGDLANNTCFQDVQIVDGGFALHSSTKDGLALPSVDIVTADLTDAIVTEAKKALIISSAGSAGIVNISADLSMPAPVSAGAIFAEAQSQCSVVKAGPNTNLLCTQTSIPIMKSQINLKVVAENRPPSINPLQIYETWLASAVFAVSGTCLGWGDMAGWWKRVPRLELQRIGGDNKLLVTDSK